jgi:hypothetical protein
MGFFNDYYIDLLGFSAGFFSQKVEILNVVLKYNCIWWWRIEKPIGK